MSITGTPAPTAGRWPRLATAALLALLLAVLFAVAATLLNAPSASASPVAPAPPGDPFAPTEPGSPDGDGGFSVEINGPNGTPSSAVITLLGITLLSVAPALLLMMTSFTKIFVVLAMTRNALALPSIPPNQVLAGLALFLSLFIMWPVLTEMNDARRAALPGRAHWTSPARSRPPRLRCSNFMLAHTRRGGHRPDDPRRRTCPTRRPRRTCRCTP